MGSKLENKIVKYTMGFIATGILMTLSFATGSYSTQNKMKEGYYTQKGQNGIYQACPRTNGDFKIDSLIKKRNDSLNKVNPI